jgi:hypothetical protein
MKMESMGVQVLLGLKNLDPNTQKTGKRAA